MPMVDRGQLERFFAGLRSRARLARKVDAQLDRKLARRFNVLDYIRTSELGLSRVIGDLLDPKASHGQDLLFLDTLLHGLKISSEKLRRPLDITYGYGDEDGWTVRPNTVQVRLERTITSGRRLDVSVEFEGRDGRRRCLAIENKTGAGDQRYQVRDYLKFLDGEYGRVSGDGPKGHCLMYLSPQGEPPSTSSVSPTQLKESEKQFAVWSYTRRIDGDIESEAENAGFRLDYSVSDWLSACRKACDVDRLRWFFQDAEGYCEREFGGVTMIGAGREEIDLFLAQPENVEAAATVVERWPEVRAGVVKQFVEHLKSRIESATEKHGTLLCRTDVTGDANPYQSIRLFRGGGAWRVRDKTVEIKMEAQRGGLRDWIIGVGAGDRAVCDALKDRLKALGEAKSTETWPWFNYIRKWGELGRRFDSWHDPGVVMDLAREARGEGSAATDFLVERFVDICDRAVPIIDETIREVGNSTE